MRSLERTLLSPLSSRIVGRAGLVRRPNRQPGETWSVGGMSPYLTGSSGSPLVSSRCMSCLAGSSVLESRPCCRGVAAKGSRATFRSKVPGIAPSSRLTPASAFAMVRYLEFIGLEKCYPTVRRGDSTTEINTPYEKILKKEGENS